MFVTAMDQHHKRATTENGRPSLASAGDARVEAFFKLVRGLTREETDRHVDAILEQAQGNDDARGGDAQAVVDVFVLWAATRDVRGGKGERDLANWMLATLVHDYPETVTALLPLIPEYGSWLDVVSLMELEGVTEDLKKDLVSMMARQLRQDAEAERPSLCGKWAPRPKSAHGNTAKKIATALFPCESDSSALYRKMLAGINAKLGTVETLMCSGKWASIQPATVPARCLKINRAAFLNKKNEKNKKNKKNENTRTGTVRSDDPDRIECAANFTAHAIAAAKDPSKARMHGRVLHPHEMVSQYMKGTPFMRSHSGLEDDLILEAQWADLRERLREEMPLLGKMIPLVDVSGSMGGTPMEVAIALGILISELGVVRDRFVTFSSEPTWHHLDPSWSLREKVRSARSANWGQTTDLQKALDMILQACVEGDVPPHEVGDLSFVILSDMQFDMARRDKNPWETQYEALVSSFKETGLKSKWGTPYPVPNIVFWNLRSGTKDFPVDASTRGVQMVSGFSSNMLKLFMKGDLDQLQGATTGDETGPSPYDTLRSVLDDPRYHAVRDTCARVGEGVMANYEAGKAEDEV